MLNLLKDFIYRLLTYRAMRNRRRIVKKLKSAMAANSNIAKSLQK